MVFTCMYNIKRIYQVERMIVLLLEIEIKVSIYEHRDFGQILKRYESSKYRKLYLNCWIICTKPCKIVDMIIIIITKQLFKHATKTVIQILLNSELSFMQEIYDNYFFIQLRILLSFCILMKCATSFTMHYQSERITVITP